MIALLQRVKQASVTIDNKRVAEIGQGTLALVAVQKEDSLTKAKRLFERIINYRMFSDDAGKMNLNLQQTEGGLLLVPQFTLAADTSQGNRPSFSRGADPAFSRELYEQFTVHAKQEYSKVEQGVFGADMQVALTNDGPVTFWIEV